VVVATRRRRWGWLIPAAIVVLAPWIAVAVTPSHPSNQAAGILGFLVIGAWMGQIAVAFIMPAPKRELAAARPGEWLWWSLVPGGLGSWVVLLAGVKTKRPLWIAAGIVCEVCALLWVLILGDSIQNTLPAGLALAFFGWFAGVAVALQIRSEYASDQGWPAPRFDWPSVSAGALKIGRRYALGALVVVLAIGFPIIWLVLKHAQPGVAPALGLAGLETLFALAAVPLVLTKHLHWRDLGLRPTVTKPAAGYASRALAAYFAFVFLWLAIIGTPTQQANRKLTGVSYHHLSGPTMACFALGIAICAPVCEEIFFRGVLYRSLRNRFSMWPAALIAGALFGLMHAAGWPLDTLPIKASFGVLMCLLYERTGSILPCIAVHAFVDGTALASQTGNLFIWLLAALMVFSFGALPGLLNRGRRSADHALAAVPSAYEVQATGGGGSPGV
jgi:hypothetical protein